MASRPELFLKLKGLFDPLSDAAALRRLRVEQKIDARRQGDASLETILETLYTETFSADRLAAERAKLTPAAPATPPPATSSPAPPRPPRHRPPPRRLRRSTRGPSTTRCAPGSWRPSPWESAT